MSTRKDKVQIEVEINGKKAGVEVQKLEQKVARLDAELKELPKGSDAAKKKMKELAAATKELDRARPTFANLKKDARALARELDQLEEGTDAFKKKAAELAAVNTRLRQIRQSTRGVSQGMRGAKASAASFGKVLSSLGIIALLARVGNMFLNLIDTSTELSKVQRKTDAQMQATLTSTGEVAGRNLEQLKKQASDLQAITLFGDEQTQQAQSLLLTFTNVREEIFDQSIPLIQDYATAMATAAGETVDMKSAAIQVGKALNDPIVGFSALAESGVSFSEDQKKVIRALQESGDIAGAQAIILKELETQFGGSAEAAAKAAGTFEQTKNKFSDLLEQLGDFFVDFLDLISPVLDVAIDYISRYFTVLAAVFKQVPVIFAGVKAAAKQGIDNLKAQFEIGILNAKIFAKELDLAISLKDSTKKRLNDELDALRSQREDYRQAGKSIGEAYAAAVSQAKDEAAAKDAQKQADRDRKFAAAQREADAKAAAERQAQAAAAAKKAADEREKFQAQQLARAKAAFEKENLLAEAARLSGEQTQADYDGRIAANKVEFYRKQLSLLTAFGQEESNEFLRIQNELLKVTDRGNTDVVAPLGTFTPDEIVSRAPSDSEADIEGDQARETELLRAKFENALIAEQDYELASLELKAAALDRRIALEAEKGEISKADYLRLQNDRLAIQNEINAKEVENVQRTEEAKTQIQKAGLQAAGQLLDIAIGFLKDDENARKKHAGVIKAFESAKVLTNVFAEISAIWKNANASPTNILVPGSGAILASVQTAAALGRSAAALSNIQKTKFAAGGFTGKGYGMPDSTGFRPVGTVHEDEWVMPKWMVEHPVYGDIARRMEGIRQNGYAAGGLVTKSTTPAASVAPALDPMPGAALNSAAIEKFYKAVDLLTTRRLKADVVYEDFKTIDDEAQASELNSGI